MAKGVEQDNTNPDRFLMGCLESESDPVVLLAIEKGCCSSTGLKDRASDKSILRLFMICDDG